MQIFTGLQIVTSAAVLSDHALLIDGQDIAAIVPTSELPADAANVHQVYRGKKTDYLLPGFIDLHIHGNAGHDVMDGTLEALLAISQSLAANGVTGFLATTMTAPDAHIEKVLLSVAAATAQMSGAALLGVHLEGPFIATAKKGAQAAADRQTDAKLVHHWQQLAQGLIRMLTFAPECLSDAQFIAALTELNIIPAVGHTNASYAETAACIQAGAKHATHLFNAMRSLHHREPGATGALLLADEVLAELIVDHQHLHPQIVTLALRIKGKDRLALVTDAMRATCMPDGKYSLGGQQVSVHQARAQLADGTLAGSVLTMPNAIRNFMQATQSSIVTAVQLASLNPARHLQLKNRGQLSAGFAADCVWLNADLEVKLTLRDGQVIFKT